MSSVLITGASKGIGRATAAELAQRGHRVIGTARNPRTLDDLDVDQRLSLDVTDQASVQSAIEQAGEIDVLISNAGAIFVAAAEASPTAEIERLLAQNTVGAIRVVQAVLPQMRQRKKGRLLFVSSVAGRAVLPGSGAYSATKWALEAFAEALALELADFGIDVSLAEPGAVSSGALDDVLTYSLPDDPYAAQLARRGAPSGMISPERVAAALADLVERTTVPLRVPIGAWAERVIAARNAAPYDQPFSRPTSMNEFLVALNIVIPDSADPAEIDRVRTAQGARVKELTAAGYVRRLWKPATNGTTIALCRATDETDLRAALDTLPTHKWHKLEVTELLPHPSDPALT